MCLDDGIAQSRSLGEPLRGLGQRGQVHVDPGDCFADGGERPCSGPRPTAHREPAIPSRNCWDPDLPSGRACVGLLWMQCCLALWPEACICEGFTVGSLARRPPAWDKAWRFESASLSPALPNGFSGPRTIATTRAIDGGAPSGLRRGAHVF